MMGLSRACQIGLFMTALKVLLIPSYHSTDFEVHRNWLAITHSLPMQYWYLDKTSEWTLDYPPLFAWFEYVLSQFAVLFDPKMLEVTNLLYKSFATIAFQRLSVILTDMVFIYAINAYSKVVAAHSSKEPSQVHTDYLCMLVLGVCNFGLFFIDHMHFQYNAFLFGLLVLSILRIMQGRVLEGALLFSTLLNFKHIFLYIAPAYFVYLFRNYCFKINKDGSVEWRSFYFSRFLTLGFVVITVFLMSFGPFIVMGQIGDVLHRLFPFKRGLCHAYWAPNFWSLYNIADKVLSTLSVKFGLINETSLASASMTGGLVQEFQHHILPSIPPIVTLICTILAMIPALLYALLKPTGPFGFIQTLVLCAFASFMFGWHVHEKAILIITIPLCLTATLDRKNAQMYILLSTVGHFSLLPLVFTPAEKIIKYCFWLGYTCVAFIMLGRSFKSENLLAFLHPLESLYLLGLIPLEFFCGIIHPYLFNNQLPFLPLLLTSVYCAFGITYSWIKYYYIFLYGLNSTTHIPKNDTEPACVEQST